MWRADGVVPETGEVEDKDDGEEESEGVGVVGAWPAVGLGGDAGEEGQQGGGEEEGEGVQLVQQRVEGPDEVLAAVHAARSTSSRERPEVQAAVHAILRVPRAPRDTHVDARSLSSARHGPGCRPAAQAARRVCPTPPVRAHRRLCLRRRNDRPL